MHNMRVVFSMDRRITFVLDVIGVLANFRGLKLSMAFKVLLDVMGLIRMSTDNEFKVASTTKTSLRDEQALVSHELPHSSLY